MIQNRTWCKDLSSLLDGSEAAIYGWVQSSDELVISDHTGRVTVVGIDSASLKTGDLVQVTGVKNSVGLRAGVVQLIFRPTELATDTAYHEGSNELISKSLWEKFNFAAHHVRNMLRSRDFIEIKTPLLWSSVQEYAEQEMVVTTHPAEDQSGFYLLQSPLMPSLLAAIRGLDRTFQFAHCVRREDQEAPRNALEFTQLMFTLTSCSFQDVQSLAETLIAGLTYQLTGIEVETPFRRMTYDEALLNYGHDSPDIRYPILTPWLPGEWYGLSNKARAIVIPKGLSSTMIDSIAEVIRRHWANDFWMATFDQHGYTHVSGGLRYRGNLWPPQTPAFRKITQGVVFVLPNGPYVQDAVNILVNQLGHLLELKTRAYAFVWVERFPFLHDPEHPFLSQPIHRSRSVFGKLEKFNDGSLRVVGADLVLNGTEVATGGEKESNVDQLVKNLCVAGMTNLNQYRYYLEALASGAPPLLTLAIGWDRLMWLLLNLSSVHEAMLFPKSGTGVCRTSGAPVAFANEQRY